MFIEGTVTFGTDQDYGTVTVEAHQTGIYMRSSHWQVVFNCKASQANYRTTDGKNLSHEIVRLLGDGSVSDVRTVLDLLLEGVE